MTKYLTPTLIFVLFLYGLLVLHASMFYWGIGTRTVILPVSTLIGFVALLSNRKFGSGIVLIAMIVWLLTFFERAAYVLLYDIHNIFIWVIVGIPIFLSIIIMTLTYRSLQAIQGKGFNLRTPLLLIVGIASVALLSFVRKDHTNEFNCWYYFDKGKEDFRVTFAVTPDQMFETTTNSIELKDFVLKYGIRDEFRNGIYCPETKVRIVTRFKKVVAVKILGFRNSTTDFKAILDRPVELDMKKILGDKKILEPKFTLSD